MTLKIKHLGVAAALTMTFGQVHAQDFAYGEALQKSIYFYEAQQAGPLPEWNRVPWRGDSTPDDGADVGLDLRGGWFDAGDHVKFGFPMASSATLLAWSVVDYRSAYANSGQLEHMLKNLRFVNDYFINAHPSANEFFGQVGIGSQDHTFWGPAEVLHHKIPGSRVSMKIDLNCPGVDLASETAAAMAASSMAFQQTDGAYASELLSHAEQLFNFAEATKGTDGADNNYSNCITDSQAFYNANYGVYWDEMAWAAVWLWRATGDNTYLDKAIEYYDLMGTENQTTTPIYKWAQSWNDKAYGVYALLAALVGDTRYHEDIQRHLDHWSIGEGRRTPGGIIVVDPSGWGVNRYAANTALLALYYADALGPNDPLYSRYHNFGKTQIDYILGDNPLNLSYMVGFGPNYPINVHHRGSHGSWADSLEVPEQQRHILYGAVAGGPDQDTNYDEDRGDYVMNEVATDYNSGFTGAVAILFQHYGGAAIPDSQFPPPEPPEADEYFVGAKVNSSGPRHLEMKVVMQNRSTTPARGRNDLYFRYFYDLSEAFAAGYDASDLSVTAAYSQASSVSNLQHWDGNIYYVEVRFEDDVIFPGGQSEHRREVQFRVSLPTTTDAALWDNSNDPSWDNGYSTTSENYGMPAPRIPVYGTEGKLWGSEPDGDVPPTPTPTVTPSPSPSPSPTPSPNPTPTPTPTPSPTPTPTPSVTPTPVPGGISCEVTYVNNWGSGYQMDVTVTNTGSSAVNAWEIALDFGEAPQVTGSWNVDLDTVGNTVVARNISWNGNLGSGQSTSFGFQGNHDGSLNTPTCNGPEDPEPTPTPSPSPVPSPSPTPTPSPSPVPSPTPTPSPSPVPSPTPTPSPTPSPTPTPVPAGNCEFVVADQWNSGFVGQIVITNDGNTAINGWNVSWEFTDGSAITNSWNANVTGNNPYSASDNGWNGNIQPGQSVSFGFQGSSDGSVVVPTVAGDVCG